MEFYGVISMAWMTELSPFFVGLAILLALIPFSSRLLSQHSYVRHSRDHAPPDFCKVKRQASSTYKRYL
ncbi:hypothetical protein Kkor_1392 [Kangiella koreensis DSM 16069]|uniref:Uncharacterized protein n=1 Tax=Kangiella koreensis (strain DSM 16069 / JCM 12317 / KCTC 12182 / SW-125) TaxID=523791 RepID=C7RC13_KANKD|nr:hypothetical protein Kkor_1392 [Kangiella koreensis DSM 16069]